MKPTIIEEEVKAQIEEIHKMELGDEKTRVAIDGVCRLASVAAEMEKIEIEKQKLDLEQEKIENEKEANEIEKNDRKTRHILEGIGIGAPIAAYIWAVIYNWHKEGPEAKIMTFSMGKKAIDKIGNIIRR